MPQTLVLWLVMVGQAVTGNPASTGKPWANQGWLPYYSETESIDVPAIPGFATDSDSVLGRYKWTCADKTRILLHDEQTPPQYWCHRVQP